MYKAIARNKRNTRIALGLFIALFGLIASPFFYYAFTVTPTKQNHYDNGGSAFGIGVGIIAFATFYAVVQYFNAAKLAIAASGAQLADYNEYPLYFQVCQELAIGYGINCPQLYIIEDDAPNAFATGRDPKRAVIAVTTGMLQRMERPELEGVLAHEFAHIKNYDIRLSMIVFGMVAAIALLCDIMRWFAYSAMFFPKRSSRKRNDSANAMMGILVVGALVAAVVLPFLSALIQLFISRQREYAADATAAAQLQNPIGLAMALEKLEDPSVPDMRKQFTASAHLFFTTPLRKKGLINRLFDTHPPLEKRIARLLDMKDKFNDLPSTKLRVPVDERGRPIAGARGVIDANAGEIVWDSVPPTSTDSGEVADEFGDKNNG
jgi:heat shock protein HtpX